MPDAEVFICVDLTCEELEAILTWRDYRLDRGDLNHTEHEQSATAKIRHALSEAHEVQGRLRRAKNKADAA